MDLRAIKTKLLPFLSKWWLSLLLVLFSWFIIEQFYIALRYNIFYAVNYSHVFGFSILYFLMDNLTLILHEAGHTIFGIFGWRFLTVLGGTLMQLIIPTLIIVFGWMNRKLFITQAALYWLGFAWLDTAAYCADAYSKSLPLLGNLPKSAHDFSNLLSALNILDSYSTVAWILFSIGIVALLVGILLPLFHSSSYKEVDLDLKL
ncbi:MAG: hypothetical protein JXR20_11370 [Balneola sp.]